MKYFKNATAIYFIRIECEILR